MKLRSHIKEFPFADLNNMLIFCEKEKLTRERGSEEFEYYTDMAEQIRNILLTKMDEYVEFGSYFNIHKNENPYGNKSHNQRGNN